MFPSSTSSDLTGGRQSPPSVVVQDTQELLQADILGSITNNDLSAFQSLITTAQHLPPTLLTSALNLSLRTNKPTFVQKLLIDLHAPFDRLTGLEVIRGGNPDTLRLLLSNGMSFHGTSNSGHMSRPIELALKLDNAELVSVLLEAQTDIDTQELQCAVTHASIDVLKLLLSKSVNNRLLLYQCGALQVAAEAGRVDMIEYLLRLTGMDIDNQKYIRGTSALMEAVTHSQIEAVRELLVCGADPNLPSNGRKPVEVAKELEGEASQEIMEMLMAVAQWNEEISHAY